MGDDLLPLVLFTVLTKQLHPSNRRTGPNQEKLLGGRNFCLQTNKLGAGWDFTVREKPQCGSFGIKHEVKKGAFHARGGR